MLKKATLLPVGLIISLVITAIMVIVFVAFLLPLLFGGPQYTTFNDLYDTIDEMCQKNDGTSYQISLFVPDSIGTNKIDMRFYYFVVEDNKLKLKSRSYFEEYENDWGAGFITAAARGVLEAGIPATEVEKERELKHCRNIQICGLGKEAQRTDFEALQGISAGADVWGLKLPSVCDSFAFESNIGQEMMDFIFLRAPALSEDYKGTLVMGINRNSVCGDGRCCGDERNFNENTKQYTGACAEDCFAGTGLYTSGLMRPCQYW